MAGLVESVEQQLIPRLLAMHRRGAADAEVPAVMPAAPVDAARIEALAQWLLVDDLSRARGCLQALQAEGCSLETLCLHVMAPAARHLGVLWDADRCDFTQVTIGLWRLQQLMYELSPAFQLGEAARDGRLRRALLVPVPGSQHTLGLLMVAEFFRRAGWQVWGDPTVTLRQLVEQARNESFDLIGFSVGTPSHFGLLKTAIASVRAASRNAMVKVLVGGPPFVTEPGLARSLGADASAADATQAVEQAERWVAATPTAA